MGRGRMRRGWDIEVGICKSQRNKENYCIVQDHAPCLSQRGGPTSLWDRGSMVLDYAITAQEING